MSHWRRTCVAREAGHCVADKLRTDVCREVVALTTFFDVHWATACPASRHTEVNVSLPEHTSTKPRFPGSGPGTTAARLGLQASPRGTATSGPLRL